MFHKQLGTLLPLTSVFVLKDGSKYKRWNSTLETPEKDVKYVQIRQWRHFGVFSVALHKKWNFH